ncbi:CGCGG family rSAM-modified RiPP protein [Neobacillus sp. PS3-40]|uniref:CGCGG family putative rSAM-modified RiPP protein n=1 Tax=Neobacillus sp. PS3-40 TaxID=3070679 RepID=UPI0027E151A8|nr:CGCGG family rSAM-modified RiPP protein [Neobacillus sp. PS3-40]WML43253.1 CGCGG family rSAM-modified RiPP protein [Neobacillus sp. PS3-40]
MDKDWTKDLEHDEYENDIDLIIKDALTAVEETNVGVYVNLVTSEVFGSPVAYLQPLLEEMYPNQLQIKFIDQCGCGGYVLRVWKLAEKA